MEKGCKTKTEREALGPTRLLTVLSSPPSGTLAAAETVAYTAILAAAGEPAVWSICIDGTGWRRTTRESP